MSKLKLKLDADIQRKLEEITVSAGYSSVEEFVLHIIEREVKALDEAESDEELKRRLKGLGYIS